MKTEKCGKAKREENYELLQIIMLFHGMMIGSNAELNGRRQRQGQS